MDHVAHRSRDTWIWTGVGAVAGFTFLSLASIGLLVLPLLAALTLVAFRLTDGRGSYGLMVGFGLLVVAITLPQEAFRGFAVFGALVAAMGVASCLVSARRAS
jgi:hypothetical protein